MWTAWWRADRNRTASGDASGLDWRNCSAPAHETSASSRLGRLTSCEYSTLFCSRTNRPDYKWFDAHACQSWSVSHGVAVADHTANERCSVGLTKAFRLLDVRWIRQPIDFRLLYLKWFWCVSHCIGVAVWARECNEKWMMKHWFRWADICRCICGGPACDSGMWCLVSAMLPCDRVYYVSDGTINKYLIIDIDWWEIRQSWATENTWSRASTSSPTSAWYELQTTESQPISNSVQFAFVAFVNGFDVLRMKSFETINLFCWRKRWSYQPSKLQPVTVPSLCNIDDCAKPMTVNTQIYSMFCWC